MINIPVSVVIPTYNGGKTLGLVIEKIFKQDYAGETEVICIDSGSKKDTLEIFKFFPQVIIKTINRREFDHGLTRDLGISLSKSDFVVLMTQDAVPFNEFWLSNLIKPFFTNSQIAGVYSRQLPWENADPFAKKRLNAWAAGRKEPDLQKIDSMSDFKKMDFMQRLQLIAFDHVSCAIRRDVWKQYPHGKCEFGEDLLWARKVLDSGYYIFYEPTSLVIHSHKTRLIQEFKRTVLDHRNLAAVLEIDIRKNLLQMLFSGFNGGFRDFFQILDDRSIQKSKLFWSFYSFPYNVVTSFAQYLGARSTITKKG
jgi:rhamnosyltransferase